ncbi:hypothetical protein [Vibrio vulnificus]|uniref:hypothetical protein n=1 Tax=Vibrio vulnificus TaxID=672 RepID=UPI003567F5C6
MGRRLDGDYQIHGSAHVCYVVAEHSGVIDGDSTSFIQHDGDVITQQQVLKNAGGLFQQSYSNKDYLARISIVSPSGRNFDRALQNALSNFNLAPTREMAA